MRPLVVPFFIAHLGCPHRCVFCNQEKIAGARGALPDAAAMLAKIAQYRQTARGRELEVAFYGGTFTALPREEQEYLLGALQPLIGSGVVRSVRLSTRPDAVDPETASLLRDRGVAVVELGVQSMHDEVLALSRRGHTSADVERAVAILQQEGIEVGIQLMPGLPGDSAERSLASLERALALRPSFLRIYPTLVISGTELAETYRAGAYHPLSLDDAVLLCKEMLLEARRADVPVVRMGLQPTDELEAPGVVLAGPYHAAFGQLVESELVFDAMCRLAAGLPKGSRIRFCCGNGRVSDLVGQRRRNLLRLEERFGITVSGVGEDAALGSSEISLECEGERRTRLLLEP